MTIALKGFKKILKNSAAVTMIAVAVLFTATTNAQSGEPEDQDQPSPTQSGTPGGPWGNSAGSTIGTPDAPAANGTVVNPLGPGGGTLGRPVAGPTPDATGGPGGNPDVPFDTNMNLIFLGAGIFFAYVVYRRRFKLKPLVVEKK